MQSRAFSSKSASNLDTITVICFQRKIPVTTAPPTDRVPLTFYLKDEADTCALGAALAGILEKGLGIHLKGGLGAGKTTLTRALLRATGYQGKVKSPTYTLVEPYTILLGNEQVELLHFDLYRMGCAEEFLDAGFRESFNGSTIHIIEWAENADALLEPPDIIISLSFHEEGRQAVLSPASPKGVECLDRLAFTRGQKP